MFFGVYSSIHTGSTGQTYMRKDKKINNNKSAFRTGVISCTGRVKRQSEEEEEEEELGGRGGG